MMADYFGAGARKVKIKGGRTSASQRDILGRAIKYADKHKAPYAAKIAMIEALIQESEAKNLRTASSDGYGSYGVLQGFRSMYPMKKLLSPEFNFGVFLGTAKNTDGRRTGWTGKGGAISLARSGMAPHRIAQTVEGSAYPERYAKSAGEAKQIMRLYRAASGQGASAAAAAPAASPAAVSSARMPMAETAADLSRRRQVIVDMMTADNPNNPMIATMSSSPVFTPPPAPKAAKTPKVAPKAAPRAPATAGNISFSPGADRAGMKTNAAVKALLAAVAGKAGRTLVVGTGTNHSQMTTSGNVSDHWSGNAVDVPASGEALTRLGRQALVAAGMPWSQAKKINGGLFNLTYRGKRAQIIFNTNTGGNHYNHLHVGLS
jgi:hypothetical protein